MGIKRFPPYLAYLNHKGLKKECFHAFFRFIQTKAEEDNADVFFRGEIPDYDATISDLTQFLGNNMRHPNIHKCFYGNLTGSNGRIDLLYPKIKDWFDNTLTIQVRHNLGIWAVEKTYIPASTRFCVRRPTVRF